MSDTRLVPVSGEHVNALFDAATQVENYGGLLGNPIPGLLRQVAYAHRAAVVPVEVITAAMEYERQRWAHMDREPTPDDLALAVAKAIGYV